MKATIVLLINLCFLFGAFGQSVKILSTGTKSSIRGVSVVNDKVVWVSGSGGTVGRSIDGGLHWKWITVKGYEKNDFRDIEAFDARTAVIMGIADPAYILKTIDGGENWKVVFENKTKGMFLDAMEFWNNENGTVIGDPIDGKFFISHTTDGGETWSEDPRENYPMSDSGEACFASSGTNVRMLSKQQAVFVTGGLTSHLIRSNHKMRLPLIQGTSSTGANSIALRDFNTMMVVGGDFNAKDSVYKNCFITHNAGKSWMAPQVPPHGYRSCVEYLGNKKWISCGLNGVDYSMDDGKTFSWISADGFHVVRKAKKGRAVFFAGGGGKIGKLVY